MSTTPPENQASGNYVPVGQMPPSRRPQQDSRQQPPAKSVGSKTGPVIVTLAIVLLVVIGVVVWSTVRRSSEPGTTPSGTALPVTTPSGSFGLDAWSAPIPTGMKYPAMFNVGLGNVVVAYAPNLDSKSVVKGINIDTGSIIWTQTDAIGLHLGGDSTGFALLTDTHLLVIDPSTGATIGEADITTSDTFLWAGEGFVLTENSTKDQICARRMNNPGKCAWSAPDIQLPYDLDASKYMRSGYVFGDGKWVNTGDGVRELATGKRAKFGQDTNRNSPAETVFVGSAGRIFKVNDSYDDMLHMKFQPWDTSTDKQISPQVSADTVSADPASSVYLAFSADGASRTTTVTAYDWATGEPKWQKSMDSADAKSRLLIGGYLVTESDYSVMAYDELTGDVAWQDNSMATIEGVRDGYVYFSSYAKLKASNSGNKFSTAQQVSLPEMTSTFSILVLPDAVCVMSYDGNLYVLHG